jgi:hypothetical protein
MAPHDDGVESLAAQSRLVLVRPGRPPLSVADLFQSKAVLDARLTGLQRSSEHGGSPRSAQESAVVSATAI